MGTRRRRIVARRSAIHGRGVFAVRRIRAGSRIVEYTGERIDHDEVQARYAGRGELGHTMLFELGGATLIDATRHGNIARYINHSCAGNCCPVLDGDRIFIEAIKNIQPGVELTYDYRLQRPGRQSAAVRAIYACRCGTRQCRGTLLERPRQRTKRS
jgi:SET domain-containing protein